jgi:hypothetical protein
VPFKPEEDAAPLQKSAEQKQPQQPQVLREKAHTPAAPKQELVETAQAANPAGNNPANYQQVYTETLMQILGQQQTPQPNLTSAQQTAQAQQQFMANIGMGQSSQMSNMQQQPQQQQQMQSQMLAMLQQQQKRPPAAKRSEPMNSPQKSGGYGGMQAANTNMSNQQLNPNANPFAQVQQQMANQMNNYQGYSQQAAQQQFAQAAQAAQFQQAYAAQYQQGGGGYQQDYSQYAQYAQRAAQYAQYAQQQQQYAAAYGYGNDQYSGGYGSRRT